MSENQPGPPETALSGRSARPAPDTSSALLEEAYEELKAVAGAVFRRERGDHTLQPTALVHEAWMRLAGQREVRWTGKGHFLAVAAEVMRRLLVDHARKRATLRRGGDAEHLAIDADLLPGPEGEVALVDLDEALERLQAVDPERARVIVRRVFGGMTNGEIGEAEGVCERTIERRWRAGCAWLAKDLRSGGRR